MAGAKIIIYNLHSGTTYITINPDKTNTIIVESSTYLKLLKITIML